MRFFVSRRLPFGLRAGFSIPTGSPPGRGAAVHSGIGYVYVIAAADGMVKIGQTTSPRARLASLQTASRVKLEMAYLLATDQDPSRIEAAVHHALAAHRCAGEWFDVRPDVAIAAIDVFASSLTGERVAHTDTERVLQAVRDGRISLEQPPHRRWISQDAAVFLALFAVIMTGGYFLLG